MDIRGFLLFQRSFERPGTHVQRDATTNVTEAARVLIVDDERDGATSLGMLLKLRGYAVEVVTDGTQCLTHLESFKPDLVVLDIAMPQVSGYEIAKQIRMKPEFEKIAIVAMSGFADNAHRIRSIESGCDQHLVKPFDLATLETIIIKEIGNKKGLRR